ncbi:MAG TPA: hypothetical protein VJ385_21885 [Fibrobacteria bacterium]|nr:hypothetical protein [Fibrobacteria bacterium]
MLSDDILNSIRKELRQIFPDIKVHVEEIKDTLEREVLKRGVVEGEDADKARKKISRADGRQQKGKEKVGIQKESIESADVKPE